METNITILHKTGDDVFRPYRVGDQLEQVFSTRIGLTDPPTDRTELQSWLMTVAECVFSAANDHPECGWDKFRDDYYGQHLRSLSVGDVVVIGESAVSVASFGFDPAVLP